MSVFLLHAVLLHGVKILILKLDFSFYNQAEFVWNFWGKVNDIAG